MNDSEKNSLSETSSTARMIHGAVRTDKAISGAVKGAATGGLTELPSAQFFSSKREIHQNDTRCSFSPDHNLILCCICVRLQMFSVKLNHHVSTQTKAADSNELSRFCFNILQK